jgi:hypothetical protein
MRFTQCVHSFNFTNMFYKSILTTTFPIFRNSINGKDASLVLFLSLKIMRIPPKLINVFVDFIFYKTPLGYDQIFKCKSTKKKNT